jgi:hypothetical protein
MRNRPDSMVNARDIPPHTQAVDYDLWRRCCYSAGISSNERPGCKLRAAEKLNANGAVGKVGRMGVDTTLSPDRRDSPHCGSDLLCRVSITHTYRARFPARSTAGPGWLKVTEILEKSDDPTVEYHLFLNR